ncbi:hypothetical protein A4R28_21765 [Mesorhizobium ciceri]|nr:hypothetical protein A4R28_21765 [Mesorhizobium ciceri]
MPSAQIPFLADDKLDVLGDQIDTARQLDQFRLKRTSKTRIHFDYNRAMISQPELDVRWPPIKAKSLQAPQRNINDTVMIVFRKRGREGRFTEDEMRWGAEINGDNPNNLIAHYLHAIKRAAREFLNQYPRRRRPDVLPTQQIGRVVS